MEAECLLLRFSLNVNPTLFTTPKSRPQNPSQSIFFTIPATNSQHKTPFLQLRHPLALATRPSSPINTTIPRATTKNTSVSSSFEPDPSLTNDDLRPTVASQRTFTWREMASLWVGLVVGVPSYYLAGSLVELGMAWWQGILTVVVANFILLIFLVLTGHPGTRYGVPFPVLARSAFGIRGAHVPALLRALVAGGWFGIESWIGGQAIFALIPAHAKPAGLTQTVRWLGTTPLEFACFVLFWLAQMGVVWRGMDGVRDLEKFSAPFLILCTLLLLFWAYSNAGGFGNLLSAPSSLAGNEFWELFFPSLTANIGFWATLALNIPDFTRFAKTQADQVLGQVGLPVFMGGFTLVGLAVTSSTELIYGCVISSPIQLLARIGGTLQTILSMAGISLATLTTNVAANIVAPANALVNLNPSVFSFRRGAMATALLGILFQPWRILESSRSFIYTWLVGYSALLGPIGGIILVDYYLLRSTELDVGALYSNDPSGPYWYFGGFNLSALASLVVGILPIVPGFLQKVGLVRSAIPGELLIAYNNAWFVSFFLVAFVYWCLSRFNSKVEKMGDRNQYCLHLEKNDTFVPGNRRKIEPSSIETTHYVCSWNRKRRASIAKGELGMKEGMSGRN